MTQLIGTILLWLVALALLAAYPFSEFARGMATNPDAHRRSRGAMVASAFGIALLLGLLFD